MVVRRSAGDKGLLSVGSPTPALPEKREGAFTGRIEIMIDWLKNNSTVAIVVIVCVSALLALAMWLGLDLSWLPDLLKRVTG